MSWFILAVTRTENREGWVDGEMEGWMDREGKGRRYGWMVCAESRRVEHGISVASSMADFSKNCPSKTDII